MNEKKKARLGSDGEGSDESEEEDDEEEAKSV